MTQNANQDSYKKVQETLLNRPKSGQILDSVTKSGHFP